MGIVLTENSDSNEENPSEGSRQFIDSQYKGEKEYSYVENGNLESI
jgi:hypothetical protein